MNNRVRAEKRITVFFIYTSQARKEPFNSPNAVRMPVMIKKIPQIRSITIRCFCMEENIEKMLSVSNAAKIKGAPNPRE